MKRTLVLLYGIACYAVFFATFLYAIAFLGNFAIGNSIDATPTTGIGQAIAINIGLLALFALQHSIMARPAFKRRWTQFVPTVAERSTYVLFSSLALILLFWLWQPIGAVIWQVDNPRRQRRAVRRVCGGLDFAADLDVPDQPFRSVRAAPVVAVFPRPPVH
jgi:protein-S-isoprenylcysteine O-methyltransferase Ste14